MKTLVRLLLCAPLLTACDQIQERMGMPVAAKVEAEGRAIGSGCRHAGRGLEDCFRLNAKADKAAVHTGWKEMNEYMLKNNMQSLPPEFPASLPVKKPVSEADPAAGSDAKVTKDVEKPGKETGKSDTKAASDKPGH
jgi:hypothetical protein